LEAVRSIERQLQGGSVGATCTPPTVAAGVDFKAMDQFPALVNAEMDLMAAALACGLTRVATYAIGDGEDYNIYFPWLGINGKGIEFPTRTSTTSPTGRASTTSTRSTPRSGS
jgi:hypothetical protein